MNAKCCLNVAKHTTVLVPNLNRFSNFDTAFAGCPGPVLGHGHSNDDATAARAGSGAVLPRTRRSAHRRCLRTNRAPRPTQLDPRETITLVQVSAIADTRPVSGTPLDAVHTLLDRFYLAQTDSFVHSICRVQQRSGEPHLKNPAHENIVGFDPNCFHALAGNQGYACTNATR